MTVELIKQANNAAQNVSVLLTNAVNDASVGGDYSDNWEKAMQAQCELLRIINEIKYKANTKRGIPNGQSGSI